MKNNIFEHIILYVLMMCVSLVIATLVRISAVSLGVDDFTAFITFIIVLAVQLVVFLTIIGFGLLLIVSFFFHYQQRETIKSLTDNDLKYRYIKAFNKTDTASIYKLEDIFEYNRDYEKIKQIRKITTQYEEDVRDRARRLEQAKLKEDEAAKLQMEANKLKKKE